MEENIMESTELLSKLPTSPDRPILVVVYNDDMIDDAEHNINAMYGQDYLDEHVRVVSLNTKVQDHTSYDVYIDPMVYKYQHSWND